MSRPTDADVLRKLRSPREAVLDWAFERAGETLPPDDWLPEIPRAIRRFPTLAHTVYPHLAEAPWEDVRPLIEPFLTEDHDPHVRAMAWMVCAEHPEVDLPVLPEEPYAPDLFLTPPRPRASRLWAEEHGHPLDILNTRAEDPTVPLEEVLDALRDPKMSEEDRRVVTDILQTRGPEAERAIAEDPLLAAFSRSEPPVPRFEDDLPPYVLLREFHGKTPHDVLAERITQMPDAYTFPFGIALAEHPSFLLTTAQTLLRTHPSAVLYGLSRQHSDRAADVLYANPEDWLHHLEDETAMWDAMLELADDRGLAWLQDHPRPDHPGWATAYRTLCWIHDRPVPPEVEQILREPPDSDMPVTLRVRCTACGAHAVHQLVGVSMAEPQDDWEGLCPHEPVVCPHCAAVDAFTVPEPEIDHLHAHLDAWEDAELPYADQPGGLTLRVPLVQGRPARRASSATALLERNLETPDGPAELLGWLFETSDPDLLPRARELAERFPDDGAPLHHLALAAEAHERRDEAVQHAVDALSRRVGRRAIADLTDLLSAARVVLDVRWSHGDRKLRGTLHLDDHPAKMIDDFLLEVRPTVTVGDPEDPAGWVQRWLDGERPKSRADTRNAKRKKKAVRKNKKKNRRR